MVSCSTPQDKSSMDAQKLKLYQDGKQWSDSLSNLCQFMDCVIEPIGRNAYILKGANEDAAWMIAGYLSPVLGDHQPRRLDSYVWELGK
jgi:hypothetical protein